MLSPAVAEADLIDLALSYAKDPLKYVLSAYPWGQPGGPLERHPGPDEWQADILKYMRDNLGAGRPLRIAIAGGVGPGKSALMAWVCDWGLTTAVNCRIRVTANTGPQITTATWPELVKWQRMSLWSSWFVAGDRRIRSADDKLQATWRLDAITWDEHTPEAFAGFHNEGSRIIYAFDESAAIAKSIWTESQGILSGAKNTEIIWLVLGNPTRIDTEFRTCFAGGINAHLWKSWHIDTRFARLADKDQIKEWFDAYGEDSDFYRVRVLSQFPRAGSTQFISDEIVSAATKREPYSTIQDPLIFGVDVARFGDDQTVIYMRRGRDGAHYKPIKLRGLDTQQVAARIAELNEQLKPNAIFIDEGGPGAGVVDRCRALQLPITGIDFGGTPDRSMVGKSGAIAYYNKRAEMWGAMRDWLAGATICDDPQLKSELTQVQYGYKLKDGKDCILLERKEDMKKRGLSSPDVADALALTFAYPVAYQDNTARIQRKPLHQIEYDPFKGMFERAS